MKNIQAIRGMKDLLPNVTGSWTAIEELLRRIVTQYGYNEIRFPILESTELFVRSIGDVTDIVEKEMYTFQDRNGDSLTLRPEGTASCIRAGIEHGLFYNQIQRLFYCGPMFRHERPQKGRYRQFHQFGVEAYGMVGPDIDAEIMLLAQRLWQELKVEHLVELQINSLGSADTRAKYQGQLVEYFNKNYSCLDEDSKRRLLSNPLRILDSKNPLLQELINNAPSMHEFYSTEDRIHFEGLCGLLDKLQLPYTVNPRLVRGLDYYNLTVFEWVTSETGAQNTVCAGGHYDGLVSQMGGRPTPAIGFAIGLERLISLVAENLPVPKLDMIYLVVLGSQVTAEGLRLAEKIRKNNNRNVIVNCGDGSLSSQLKRADKSEALIALILGEAELAKGEIAVKYLREDKPQQNIKFDNLENFLNNN